MFVFLDRKCDIDDNFVYEEVANAVTHGLGLVLAVLSTWAMLHRTWGVSFPHMMGYGSIHKRSQGLPSALRVTVPSNYACVFWTNLVVAERYPPFCSALVFGWSMILLYFSSTLFHAMFKLKRVKVVFGYLDHSMIYVLIAGR